MKRISIFLFALLSVSQLMAQEYKISWQDNKSIHVKASFNLESNMISMLVNPTNELADGQAHFIKNLKAIDANGDKIKIKYKGVGDWKLKAKAGDKISIEYDVKLDHEQYNWPFGIEEVAYTTKEGMFFTGLAVFVVPSIDMKSPIKVSFLSPGIEWTVSAPWTKVKDSENTYLAKNIDDLFHNCFFIGKHDEIQVAIDEFKLRLVINDSFGHTKEELVGWLSTGLRSIKEMFEASPEKESYLIIVNPGELSDGGAYQNSFSMVLNGELTPSAANVWVHGIIHEAFHLWNGISIDGDHSVEWFTEGVTDYMTVLHLSKTELISPMVSLKKLENSSRKYILARMVQKNTSSLSAAGKQKAKNRMLIYGGGAMVAFALDVEIRQATSNKVGTEDVLKSLFAEYANTDQLLTNDIILKKINALSGEDFSDFFERYILGNQMLDMKPYFNAAGLDYYSFIEEIYLTELEVAHSKNKAIRKSILGF